MKPMFLIAMSIALNASANPSTEAAESADKTPPKASVLLQGNEGKGQCRPGQICPNRNYSFQSVARFEPYNLQTLTLREKFARLDLFRTALGYRELGLKEFWNREMTSGEIAILAAGKTVELTSDERYALENGAKTFGELADRAGSPALTISRFMLNSIAYQRDPRIGGLKIREFMDLTMTEAFGAGTVATNPHRANVHRFFSAGFASEFYPDQAPAWMNSQEITVREALNKVL